MSSDRSTRGRKSSSSAVAERKDHHLDLCIDADVGSGHATGLGGFRLEYDALPEIDLESVDTGVTVLGRNLSAPLLVGAMTGGTDRAMRVNQTLARAAARVGVGMALGSQRAMIADPSLTKTFAVRDVAPELPLLLGNIGAVQLNYGVGVSALRRALDEVGADGLNFHLNALQEAIQPEGDTRFGGLHARLAEVIPELGLPVLVKEVGAGISERAAAKLARLPLAGVECAGVGGTSWAKVESFRAPEGSAKAEVGRRLAGFGIPTADSVRICRAAFGERLVVASGGIRSGMDAAVALALGADVVALAKPLLEAAETSEDACVHALATLVHELEVICFCCGVSRPRDLRNVRLLHPGASFFSSPPPVGP